MIGKSVIELCLLILGNFNFFRKLFCVNHGLSVRSDSQAVGLRNGVVLLILLMTCFTGSSVV